jgi:hypothetical protein
VHRITETHTVGQAEDQGNDGRQQAKHDDDHLLDVRPGDRLHAANHGVDRRRQANRQDRQGQVPAENDGQDHGRGRDNDAA